MKDERRIPLTSETKASFRKLPSSHTSEAIFITNAEERIMERAVQYMLKKYDVNPNKLRHTFCQRLIDHNVGLDIVSRFAGHKDINVTKRYIKSSQNLINPKLKKS